MSKAPNKLDLLSKAQTLRNLEGRLSGAAILPSFIFSVHEWRHDPDSILNRLFQETWSNQLLVVRSSSADEDTHLQSNAGKYASILNVANSHLPNAINQVADSYGELVKEGDEIFIQPMLGLTKMSGVLFTKNPDTGAPYYIIQYTSLDNTELVTSGCSNDYTLLYIYRNYPNVKNPFYKKLLYLAKELEEIFTSASLDIEFAFDEKENLYLLQVRTLITKKRLDEKNYALTLDNINKYIKSVNKKHPYLYGTKTIFGVMPDWNPAEIIGIRPRPLALSLYKELVTDNIWAYQRDNYGYKNLRSFPLLVDFYGLPYIDVRVSFNSFLPKDISPHLSEKLINYYIDKLQKNAHFHDKVEFKIIYSCYFFDVPEKLSELAKSGFTVEESKELQDSLRALTNKIVCNKKGLWKEDLEKIHILNKRRHLLFNENLTRIQKIYWLIEDCKRYGTLPFAGLARAGFIAMQILNSMVSRGLLGIEQREAFLAEVDTIGSQISMDVFQIEKEAFIEKYGHLRPGTYDICSPRYDEEPDLYFNWSNSPKMQKNTSVFELTLSQMSAIEKEIKKHGLEFDLVGLFDFIKGAIEGREYAKYVFTKNLSDVLSLIKSLGKDLNFSIDELSCSNIVDIKSLYGSSVNWHTKFKQSITMGQENYKVTETLNLPPTICSEEDIYLFTLPDSEPNFVTQKKIRALTTEIEGSKSLRGKIVFILNADPGFDWLFTQHIAGLVTAYGGANSHMAIRASEHGLPAIIGAGEKLFNQWKKYQVIEIDCSNKTVRKIQ